MKVEDCAFGWSGPDESRRCSIPMRSADYRRELAKQVEQARQLGDHHGICRLLPGEDYDEVTAYLRGLMGGYVLAFCTGASIPEGHKGRTIVTSRQEGVSLGAGQVLLGPSP